MSLISIQNLAIIDKLAHERIQMLKDLNFQPIIRDLSDRLFKKAIAYNGINKKFLGKPESLIEREVFLLEVRKFNSSKIN